MPTDQIPTIAETIPPLWRRRVYIALKFATPVVTGAAALIADGVSWGDAVAILASLIPAAGFQMAQSNTPSANA